MLQDSSSLCEQWFSYMKAGNNTAQQPNILKTRYRIREIMQLLDIRVANHRTAFLCVFDQSQGVRSMPLENKSQNLTSESKPNLSRYYCCWSLAFSSSEWYLSTLIVLGGDGEFWRVLRPAETNSKFRIMLEDQACCRSILSRNLKMCPKNRTAASEWNAN